MTGQQVSKLVQEELAKASFDNWHGITAQNISNFLVTPYQTLVDPDDLESQPRPMWIVLHERPSSRDGYVVVFDPTDGSWGVAEPTTSDTLVLLVSAPMLTGALSGM